MGLSREQMLQAGKRPLLKEWAPCPELVPDGENFNPEPNGHGVYVRVLKGSEKDGWELKNAETAQKQGMGNVTNYKSRLLVKCIVNESDQRLFNDKDVEELGALPCQVIDRLFKIAERLNGLEKKDVEKAAKNSEGGQSGASPTDSPPSSESSTSTEKCLMS